MLARFAVAAITFATPLVLARVLLPASYGTFKLAWLWCTTLGMVLPMGLSPSLYYFVPREPQRRHDFIGHALLITTALGVAAGAVLHLVGPAIARHIDKPELAANMGWVALFSALLPVPFYFLELLVGLVQAFVFMLLTTVFTALICTHEDAHAKEAH